MGGEQQQDRQQEIEKHVSRRQGEGGFVLRRGPALPGSRSMLPFEILDFPAQRLVLVEERFLNREITMAMLADDRLILDLLGAERTKQALAPRPPSATSSL